MNEELAKLDPRLAVVLQLTLQGLGIVLLAVSVGLAAVAQLPALGLSPQTLAIFTVLQVIISVLLSKLPWVATSPTQTAQAAQLSTNGFIQGPAVVSQPWGHPPVEGQ